MSSGTSNSVFTAGIVGGVGSGKSAVARAVAALDPSIRVFDADAAGHQVLEHPDIRARLASTFGPGIVGPAGTIDRRVLADLVFGDSAEARAARTALESILHPAIQQSRNEALRAWNDDPAVRGVLVDAALLLEAGWAERCDAVVFVEAPEELRRARVRARGWTDAEWARREASQWPVDKKRSSADFIVENASTLDNAARALYEYLKRQIRPST